MKNHVNITGAIPDNLIYIKMPVKKAIVKVKTTAVKVTKHAVHGAKTVGKFIGEVGKRVLSPSYTHKRIMGESFGKKKPNQ